MENRPILRFGAIRPNPEVRERFDNWFNEVYYPEFVKVEGVLAIDRYKILRENNDCPETMSIQYFKNLKNYMNYYKDPLGLVLSNDVRTTWIDRYGGERVWDCVYSLIKSFGKEPLVVSENDECLRVESPLVIHIAGLKLSQREAGRYVQWFSTTGSAVFIPLFLKMPGLKRIDFLEHTGLASARNPASANKYQEYPPYVCVFHFDSLKASEDFEKSAELAAFHEGMKVNFPGGLEYKWNVTYQLMKSFRK